MLRPAVKTGSGATVKMQMPAAGRFCPTDLHCISAAHEMYLQIMFVFLVSPSFMYLYLPLYFSCYVVQGSRVLLERPALGTRSRTTAAARGKNSTLATRLNFAQKIGSSLEMGLSVGPILAKFCATGTSVRFP